MGKRVLIVDKSNFSRMMLKDILNKNGYEIIGEAEESSIALAKYRRFMPDLVAMDITIRGTDGIDTAKSIIQLDPNARVIIISTAGQRDLVVKALQAGAKGFVVKPYDKNSLLQAFDKALSRQ